MTTPESVFNRVLFAAMLKIDGSKEHAMLRKQVVQSTWRISFECAAGGARQARDVGTRLEWTLVSLVIILDFSINERC